MENVTIDEVPFAGNPSPSDPYPQTLLISFTPAAGVTEIQIAPCWEGDIFFIADDQTGYPNNKAQVTQVNAASWPLVGDLVLVTRDLGGSAKALKTHAPLFESAPNIVRYSKVRLSTEFLFNTLALPTLKGMVIDGKLLSYSPQTDHPQFVVKFLKGEAGVPCRVDPANAANDFAGNPMPAIALQTAPAPTVLRIGMSSHSGLQQSWFATRIEDPQIANTPLVDPAIASERHARFTPAHPAHSFVPPRALYANVAPAAFVGDHLVAPLRALLTAARADGATYRRLALKRPPLGETFSRTPTLSRFPTRVYPLYQLVWLRESDGESKSQRMPLDGVFYLPLADETYRFYVSRRSDDPPSVVDREEFVLGVQTPPNRFLDLPALTIERTFAAADSASTLYAHLLRYDSDRVWEAFVEFGTRYYRYMEEAKKNWGLPFVTRWVIYVADNPATRQKTGAMKAYGRIYGFIRASAGRHGLAPEFLQAVFLGEAMQQHIEDKWNHTGPPAAFEINEVIPGFAKLGLDRIWDTVQTLGTTNYLDPTRFGRGALTDYFTATNEEDGSTIQSASAIGYEAAVEFVAAELHERLDWMLNVIGKSRSQVTELQRRFLAYGRYVSSEGTSTLVAQQMATLLKPWEGPFPQKPPTGSPLSAYVSRVRFKIIQRLAVAEWIEKSGVYR